MSGSSRTTNVPHPGALTSLFPSHDTASRNEASSHHCRHFPPLLWDKRVPHEPPGLSLCPENRGSAPQPALRDWRSLFPGICSDTKVPAHNSRLSPRQLPENAGTSSSLAAANTFITKP